MDMTRVRDLVTFEKVVGALLLVFALTSAVISIGVQRQLRQVVVCQADYNRKNADVQRIRVAFADRDRAAIDDLMQSVATAKSSTTVATALSTYIAVRAETDKQRKATPLPKFPTCGEVK